MALLFLVRHAQASFGAENYDRLSDLGREQSRWLAEYFLERGLRFGRVVAGTLVRQRDTAIEIVGAMGGDPRSIGTHAGLDEYHAESLYASYTGGGDARAHQRGDYRDYWRTFRLAMSNWAEGGLPQMPESWAEFGARVRAALLHACEGALRDEAVLVVSSGGAIGRALGEILGAPAATAIELNLQFRNSGFCELIASSAGLRLVSFNNIPHLDRAGRRHAITAT